MRPDGLSGRLFGMIMERMNMGEYRKVIALLAPCPGQAILEIGFGTGRLLHMLAKSDPTLSFAGVDPAADMVSRVQMMPSLRNADIREGTSATLDWPDANFDKIVALHSFQFWDTPDDDLTKIFALLKPGGTLLLALRQHGNRPPSWLPNHISKGANEVADVMKLLADIGFTDITDHGGNKASHIVAASRP